MADGEAPGFDFSPETAREKRERFLCGVRIGTLAVAVAWLAVFGATALAVPGFRRMFEDIDIASSRMPAVARILISISFLWWIDIAVVPAGLIVLKDPYVSARWRRFVNRAAAVVIILSIIVIPIALFLPLSRGLIAVLPAAPPPPPPPAPSAP